MSSLRGSDLARNKILSITGAVMTDASNNSNYGIYPVFKGGISNATVRSNSGDYDGGDRVIGFPNGYEVDGDLLFTVGWGDGFAVRRLNNDGTLSKIYQETNFLWRDTSSTYNHIQSVAIDTTNKLGVAMTYNVDGYTTFDYSGCVNGGTTFVKDSRPTHSDPDMFIGSQDTSNGYIRRSGLYYQSGMVAAGEWIYVGEYSATHYRRACRRNLNTGVEEIIGNSSGTGDLSSGSATIDRNGYRYTLHYDEVNDRVFYFSYYNGNFIMVLDASTSSPELVWCDIGDTGNGDDGYDMGLFIPDPVNAPNRMWTGGSNRFLDIDITPCLSGSAPTIHNRVFPSNWLTYDSLWRLGNKYQKTSGTPMDKSPSYLDFISLSPDRDRLKNGGWLDTDNLAMVGMEYTTDYTEDTSTGGRGRSFNHGYGSPMVLMESANGTKHWVKMGYGGSDGHLFMTWPENSYPNQLIGNWEIQFGTFTLDNSANIDQVNIPNLDGFYTQGGTSITVYVSNNNGSSWQTYDKTSETSHTFSTTGTQLRVKISASGHPNKAPFYSGKSAGPLKVFYGSLHAAAKDSSIKFKVNRKRLR